MKWYKDTDTLEFSACDMRVFAQCDARAGELFRDRRKNPNIPPLWSVLSYVLLQEEASSAKWIWYRYRHYLRLAQNAEQWYKLITIPKPSGGVRQLAAPGAYLSIYQRAIDEAVLRHLPVSPHAFAYQKGVSIRDCAKPHLGQEVLFHLDIEDFFGSITQAMVARRLWEETGYARSLCRFFAQMCCYQMHLPQGAPTSPVLSNIVFRPCDEALAALAEEYGMQYTRYSDDLFFSGSGDVDRTAFLERVEQEVVRKGFRLNKKKTKVLGRQNCQNVLGLTVNQHLQVGRKYRRRLLQEVYYLEQFGRRCDGACEVGYEQYLQTLLGKLSYALSINRDDEKLQSAWMKVKKKWTGAMSSR